MMIAMAVTMVMTMIMTTIVTMVICEMLVIQRTRVEVIKRVKMTGSGLKLRYKSIPPHPQTPLVTGPHPHTPLVTGPHPHMLSNQLPTQAPSPHYHIPNNRFPTQRNLLAPSDHTLSS